MLLEKLMREHTLLEIGLALLFHMCVADFGGEWDSYIVLTHLGLHHVNPNVS